MIDVKQESLLLACLTPESAANEAISARCEAARNPTIVRRLQRSLDPIRAGSEGGVVLQSTFTSMPEIGAEVFPWLPVRLISTIKYATQTKLPHIRIPVLVMHSRADDLARFHHAEKNFAAANEPKFFCELNGAHNEAVWTQPEFRDAIEKFLKRLDQTVPGR